MASPRILRHSVDIHEKDVFEAIHIARTLPEIQPSNFTGRVATWAEEQERRGDSIKDIITYTENGPHRVAWVKHEGTDEDGIPFCTHHVVCDCAAYNMEQNSPTKVVEQAVACGGVMRALQKRAAFVDHEYRTGEVLAALRDPETGDFEQSNAFHEFGVKTVASILELDARHPHEWPGNVINGEHRVSILATLFQLHPEVVKWYGTMLEEAGVITDFDGEVLKFNPEALAA